MSGLVGTFYTWLVEFFSFGESTVEKYFECSTCGDVMEEYEAEDHKCYDVAFVRDEGQE